MGKDEGCTESKETSVSFDSLNTRRMLGLALSSFRVKRTAQHLLVADHPPWSDQQHRLSLLPTRPEAIMGTDAASGRDHRPSDHHQHLLRYLPERICFGLNGAFFTENELESKPTPFGPHLSGGRPCSSSAGRWPVSLP